MKTYRLKRSILWQSMLFLAVFPTALILSLTLVFADEPPQHPWLAIAMFVGVWGGMSCLSLWLLAEYLRYRLEIDDVRVREFGVLRSRELSLPDIVDAHWRDVPMGGSLRIKGAAMTITIHFGNFDGAGKTELVRHFRASLPVGVQRGWERFCYDTLFRGRSDRPAVPTNGVRILMRRRWDLYFLISVPLFLAVGLYSWHMTGDMRALLSPLAFAPIWLVLRIGTPRTGMVVRDQPTSPKMKRLWWWTVCGSLMFFPGWGLVVILSELGHTAISMAVLAVISPLAILVPCCICLVARERHSVEERQYAAAAAEWERTEAALAQSGAAGESP